MVGQKLMTHLMERKGRKVFSEDVGDGEDQVAVVKDG